MNHVFEWFGFAAEDQSDIAARTAESQTCPFVPGPCSKRASGGACSVSIANVPVTICPKRMYFDDFAVLRQVAEIAFKDLDVQVGADDLPLLVPGAQVKVHASNSGRNRVGVFGQGWQNSGEIKLPPAMPEGGEYSIDYVLVAVDPTGALLSFAPVEVQTIDISNSYRESISQLQEDRTIRSSQFGMNWENVNKRILPQLIVKGLMLQAERLCSSGIFFITPEPVFDRIMTRLGGIERLRIIPTQPGSITFMRYQQQASGWMAGAPIPVGSLHPLTISTSDMSIAFISPLHLPPAGSYESRIQNRL
ncbi:hypothetical protein GB864_03645 [Agromyces sp. MMS17-SY077]|uniref:Restriction endonuclease type II NotI domain-containing protein n=2 Tax=Agromyces seonyuensis TaxID=2662446 RepID=A0A6I4NU78_9MICO|nr:hypothetical protein [Agromyces seonyuensis]